MSVRTIACANCGARYRIPESFQGAKARCKSCGATIEIANSIVSDDAPAAPSKPAAASGASRSASSRSSSKSSKASSARSGKGSRSSARRGAASRASKDDDGDDAPKRGARAGGRSSRGGRAAGGRSGGRAARGSARRARSDDDAPQKNNTPILIGVGAVVVLGIAGFFIFGGNGNEPGKGDGKQPGVAKNDETGKKDAGKSDATKDAGKKDATADAGKKDAGKGDSGKGDAVADKGKAAEAAGKTGDGTAEAAAAKKDADAKKAAAAAAKKKADAKKAAKSKVSPFNAKTELEDIAFPSDVTDSEKAELQKLGKDVFEFGAMRGKRAMTKLKAMPRKAFPVLFNGLRGLDYMDSDDVGTAFYVVKELEEMLLGNNIPLRIPQFGEPIKQEDSWWNQKCLKALVGFWEKQVDSGDKDAWDAWVKLRKKNLAKKEKEAGK